MLFSSLVVSHVVASLWALLSGASRASTLNGRLDMTVATVDVVDADVDVDEDEESLSKVLE